MTAKKPAPRRISGTSRTDKPDAGGPGARHAGYRPRIDLDVWLPYQLWLVITNFAACIETFYSLNYKLNRIGWQALAVLVCHAPMSAKDLAQRSRMNPVDVTRAVGQLMKLKLVRRGTSAVDRRVAVLQITPRGVETYEAIAEVAIVIEDMLFGTLSQPELAQLSTILGKLSAKEIELLEQRQTWRLGKPPQAGRTAA
ncbi:MAG: MarR family winged helix-turn-helix transcriptional regulator [Rhizomicrobium sp.]